MVSLFESRPLRTYDPEPSQDQRPIRVAIVDDHLAVLQMLRDLFQSTPDIRVVGTATHGAAALTLVQEQQPDVLILDLVLPGVSGHQIAQAVLASYPATAVVIFTGYSSSVDPRPLLAMGVRGYLSKSVSIDELVAAVRAAASGRVVTIADAPNGRPGSPLAPLTMREQEVLQLVMVGHSNADIATILSITRRTVEFHVTQVLQKLGVKSRAQAIVKAQELGFLSQPPDGLARRA